MVRRLLECWRVPSMVSQKFIGYGTGPRCDCERPSLVLVTVFLRDRSGLSQSAPHSKLKVAGTPPCLNIKSGAKAPDLDLILLASRISTPTYSRFSRKLEECPKQGKVAPASEEYLSPGGEQGVRQRRIPSMPTLIWAKEIGLLAKSRECTERSRTVCTASSRTRPRRSQKTEIQALVISGAGH
jgi:hypothetical protein